MIHQVNSVLLADYIYQDISSSKFILSGVFYQFNVPIVPFKLQKSFGIFISISGFQGIATITIKIIDEKSGTVLIDTSSIEITSDDISIPVSFGLEVPPFQVYNYGKHTINLEINNEIAHSSVFLITKIQ